MVMEYVENILQLTVTIVMQVFCLFQYMKYKRRGYVYLIAFFLCNLLSTYYWSVYLLIMGDWPNVSDTFSYLGWNVAFATMLAFILHMKTPEERRFFHPLMLLPIPVNIYQLTLYLPYGGAVNSVYQVAVMTGIAAFSLQGICWFWRNKKGGARYPYVAVGGLVFALCEFGMWTSSCFGWPSDVLNPYYFFSILCSLDFIYMGWALGHAYGAKAGTALTRDRKRQQRLLQIIYLVVVAVFCLGGVALGLWIRNTLAVAARGIAESSVYDIITVVLFVCSLVVVAFAVAIIFAVNYGEKAAESDALRAAKAVAEQSSAYKSEFLANMSHEIRTPINAILGMNEIILRESLESRDRLPRERASVRKVFGEICAYSGNIDSAGKNLLAIINDILDFSKIEAGKLELNEGEYRLSSVLNDVSNMIVFKARSKGLEYRVALDDGLPDGLYGDEMRVRQVITNILNNAVKYTNSGSVCLSVRGGGSPARVGETFWLVVSVRDTGIGIRKEDMERLFEKFERADLSRNSAVEGSGLGLAITQRLLSMMGGAIEVDSMYGEGSTFTVSIPQRVVSCEPVGDFQEKFERSIGETRARAERFRAPDARILVVDDTRMNLTVVAGLLKNTGIGVDTAESGARAVELARTNRYDVILMDQRMPVMDGTEAMRRIRADALNRDTPEICLTADAISGAREKYLAAGFDDYLTKPVDGGALEEMLLKYLPEEKVSKARPTAAPGAADAGPDAAFRDRIEALRAVGIDPDVGMGYSQNDENLYRTVLLEYGHAAPHKARGLRDLYAARDWENYGIVAHALKSTSRMIGAVALSDVAGRLERAAGEGDGAAVDREHADMLARLDAVSRGIERLFDEWEDAPLTGETEAPDAGSDGVFIEFMPED